MDRARELAVTWFYLGEFPFASGTAGSLGGVALYLVAGLWLRGAALSIFAAVAGLVLGIVGIRLGRWAQEYYKQRDPSEFVLDEVAGQLLAVVAATATVSSLAPWKIAIPAFLFFRFFDVVKLFPAGLSERLRGGWGIVLDDLISGVYAAVCVHLWFHYA